MAHKPKHLSQNSPQSNPLFTVAEIAERDRCSAKTVRRAIAAGYLDVIRIGPSGRSIRISQQAHERYRHRWL